MIYCCFQEVELLLQENDSLQMKLQSQEDEFRIQNQTLMQELSLVSLCKNTDLKRTALVEWAFFQVLSFLNYNYLMLPSKWIICVNFCWLMEISGSESQGSHGLKQWFPEQNWWVLSLEKKKKIYYIKLVNIY